MHWLVITRFTFNDSNSYQQVGIFCRYDIYIFYDVNNIKDFVIAPGQHGKIIYELTRGSYQPLTGFPPRQFLNVTNSEIFYHQENSTFSTTHKGVTFNFIPSLETLQYNKSSIIEADLSVDENASVGTYWFTFYPGPCFGPHMSFLTVGDKPYQGKID